MHMILLAPPGAGKGTLAPFLSQLTGATHVSAGDLIRDEVSRGTDVGKELTAYVDRGDLVPDDVVFRIVVPVVQEAARQSGGYLLDGFPRTLAQAHRAAELGRELELVADAVVHLTAPEPVLVERLRQRATVQGRADDNEDVVRHRLKVFVKDTLPLVEYYQSRGILHEIDADRSVDEIQDDLRRRF